MVRMDPKIRRDIVLGMVIQHYVRTIEPVSSAFIAEEYTEEISSATIRNILAELEEDGFLTHPHTSAGRVPTQRGYRYYVDFLMKEICLLDAERIRVQREYEESARELETLLEKTSEIVSDLTHCASVVSIDGLRQGYLCRGTDYLLQHLGTNDLRKLAIILRTIEQKERILELLHRDIDRKLQIYIGHETACEAFDDCAVAVSRFRTRRGPTGQIAVLGPTRMDYQRVVSALEYVSDVMREIV